MPKLEKDIQNEICEWLKENNYFFWRQNNTPIFGRNNAGKMTFRSMGKYAMKGLPDIFILFKGWIIGLEVKRTNGIALRPDQSVFRDRIESNGGLYFKVSELNRVIEILDNLQ